MRGIRAKQVRKYINATAPEEKRKRYARRLRHFLSGPKGDAAEKANIKRDLSDFFWKDR